MIDGHAELHETKQDTECRTADVQSELMAIRDEVERHPGWRYSVTLESALLAEPLCSNTDLLWRELVSDDEIDLDLRLRTLAILDEGVVTASELIGRTENSGGRPNASGSWANLLAMIAAGIVDFEVRQLLTPQSFVWNRNSGPKRGRTLPFATVEEAIKPPCLSPMPTRFCSLQIRNGPK